MSYNIHHKYKRGFIPQSAGFTLIETVVAISILMLGVLGPMELARQSIKASRDANDRLVASFLAQEGIESVRSIVVNNSGDNLNWLTNIAENGSDPCNPNRCIVDIATGVFAQCNPANGANVCRTNGVLYVDGNGVHRQPNPGAGWTASKFSRMVEIIPQEAGKRLTASTTVWWPRGNITLQEDIYNWFFQLN